MSAVETSRGPWFRLMVVAFLANGLGPFGLKVLNENGLGQQYQFQYLVFWYLGGLVFALIAFLREHRDLRARELLLGAAMGGASLAGQSFTSLALGAGVPGHVVFPMTTGGSLIVVATAGLLLFRERVTGYGLAGIALGIVSLVILSL